MQHPSLRGVASKTIELFSKNPCVGDIELLSRLTVVSREAKKKQHARASSGLRDHYSELFTQMAALKFENAVTQPP